MLYKLEARMFNKIPTTCKGINSRVDFKAALVSSCEMLLKIEPYSVSEFLDYRF